MYVVHSGFWDWRCTSFTLGEYVEFIFEFRVLGLGVYVSRYSTGGKKLSRFASILRGGALGVRLITGAPLT